MKVSKGTIARTIILALALLNSVLSAFGVELIEIPDDTINTLLDAIFLIVAAITAWWKNNSFTKSAIQADMVLKDLKTYGEEW